MEQSKFQRGQSIRTKAFDSELSSAKEEAWESGSLYQHANDKPYNVQAAIEHFSPMLTSADAGEREKAAVFYEELKAMSPNASGAVKKKIDAAFEAHGEAHSQIMRDGKSSISLPDSDSFLRYPPSGQAGPPRRETGVERVKRLSRGFERPDPNNI